MTAAALTLSATSRRLSGTVRADDDRRRSIGPPAADRHHRARRLCRPVRGRAAAWQRHHRSHLARQHPNSRIERGVGAAFCGRGCRSRYRCRRRHSGSDQSAGRPRCGRHYRCRRARRRFAPRALARVRWRQRLSAKVSVAIDGGGALDLDGIAADVRLRAEAVDGVAALGVSVGGDGQSAAHLGCVAGQDGVEVAIRLLEVLAQRGRVARMRDVVAAEGIAAFRSAVADCSSPTMVAATAEIGGMSPSACIGCGTVHSRTASASPSAMPMRRRCND